LLWTQLLKGKGWKKKLLVTNSKKSNLKKNSFEHNNSSASIMAKMCTQKFGQLCELIGCFDW
jgi:hypothetical protein